MASTQNKYKKMLTVKEVSRIINVHSNTIRRWSDRGIINTHRIGPRGDRLFSPEDIIIFLIEDNEGFLWNLNLVHHRSKKRKSTTN